MIAFHPDHFDLLLRVTEGRSALISGRSPLSVWFLTSSPACFGMRIRHAFLMAVAVPVPPVVAVPVGVRVAVAVAVRVAVAPPVQAPSLRHQLSVAGV